MAGGAFAHKGYRKDGCGKAKRLVLLERDLAPMDATTQVARQLKCTDERGVKGSFCVSDLGWPRQQARRLAIIVLSRATVVGQMVQVASGRHAWDRDVSR